MDAAEQKRFAEAVSNAYRSGNEQRLRELCRSFQATVDFDQGEVTIKAVPMPRAQVLPVEFVIEGQTGTRIRG